MPEPEWFSLGSKHEVTPGRQLHAKATLEDDIQYALESKIHLWIVFITHKATDRMLDSFDGETDELPILDADTIRGLPMVGCYLCEEAYEPKLRYSKCMAQFLKE